MIDLVKIIALLALLALLVLFGWPFLLLAVAFGSASSKR